MAANQRAALLEAVMMRNELVRSTPHGEGLRLSAPVERSALGRIFGAGGAAGREKTFELDALGTWVWKRMDGTRRVEELIRQFAAEQRVNVREAEVAIVAFLKMLAKRGLVALAVPQVDGSAGGGNGA
ncbi:MAG TPA: PqqD family protein [Phycisphaerae bacterium]|nr:PqqD family protein [Phycisphaerae bacterium]